MNEITSLAAMTQHRQRWIGELADPSRRYRRRRPSRRNRGLALAGLARRR